MTHFKGSFKILKAIRSSYIKGLFFNKTFIFACETQRVNLTLSSLKIFRFRHFLSLNLVAFPICLSKLSNQSLYQEFTVLEIKFMFIKLSVI